MEESKLEDQMTIETCENNENDEVNHDSNLQEEVEEKSHSSNHDSKEEDDIIITENVKDFTNRKLSIINEVDETSPHQDYESNLEIIKEVACENFTVEDFNPETCNIENSPSRKSQTSDQDPEPMINSDVTP